ncbi:TetR/AcrR family transcriptional regulator [Mycolicibacterium sp.]|uniref:TetR/AcrR family transcriptional regulator n=1 Tax=Mycolicibacterium sp. TaxID=2320850 RepID=UPI003D107423
MTAEPSAPNAEKGSSARREELLRVAARIFADRGYASTTTRDLAEGAKITSGSLYHHFDSKEAMVDIILRPYFAGLDALVDEINADDGSPLDKVTRLLRETLRHSADYRDAARIYIHDGVALSPMFPYIADAMDRLANTWIGALQDGIDDGSFNGSLDAAVVFRTMIGAMSYTTEWYSADGEMTMEQIGDIQMRLLLDGLKAGSPRSEASRSSKASRAESAPPETGSVHAAEVGRVDQNGGISVVIAAATSTALNAAAVDAAVQALRVFVERQDDVTDAPPEAAE